MHYSAGNAYDHLYEAECGDAVRSLLLFGQIADARKMSARCSTSTARRRASTSPGTSCNCSPTTTGSRATRSPSRKRERSGSRWSRSSATAARPTTACCPRTTTPATSTRRSTRSTRTPTAGAACATWPPCWTTWARRTRPPSGEGGRRVPQGDPRRGREERTRRRSSSRWRSWATKPPRPAHRDPQRAATTTSSSPTCSAPACSAPATSARAGSSTTCATTAGSRWG